MIIKTDLSDLDKALGSVKKKAAALSVTRLLVFFCILAVLIVGLSEWNLLLLFLPLILALFVYLILKFNEQKDLEAFILELISMKHEKSKRAERDLSGFKDGEEFLEKNHPFANDLDLFGPHSLFQLINHTVNVAGKNLLVKWMKDRIDPEVAKARFTAIKELCRHGVFIRHFEAKGRAYIKKEKSKAGFYKWLSEEMIWRKFYFLPMIAGPMGGFGLLIWTLYFELPYGWLGAWILLGLVFLSLIFQKLQTVAMVMPNQGDIKTYSHWAAMIESETFHSKVLAELHSPFKNQSRLASLTLKSLEQKSFMVQSRFNLVYLIFNLLFWLDFWVWWRLLKWKIRYGDMVSKWESSFDQWQVLVSLAAFSNEERLTGEVIWATDEILEAKQIRHPLIHPAKVVANDFALSVSQKVVLLTGSNMSGKTTFMRTIGINMVLANLGISTFAKSFECGRFQLFTSMRNTDNLGESVSSFYAELSRIKNLLEAIDSGESVFFLLDEILKGTNTTDRIMGSEALICQLAEAKGKGIISTHDIELSSLSTRLDYLVNKSFHSEIDDQEIRFDYKIKEGPCPSFNAHKLMELMGIRFGK